MGNVIKGNFGKEKTRTNTGKRGSRKTELSRQEKILMGKGAVAAMKPVNCGPWMGAGGVSHPFDPVQAQKNWDDGFCG